MCGKLNAKVEGETAVKSSDADADADTDADAAGGWFPRDTLRGL